MKGQGMNWLIDRILGAKGRRQEESSKSSRLLIFAEGKSEVENQRKHLIRLVHTLGHP